MTANQRRPGFRLPWSTEEEAAEAGTSDVTTEGAAPSADQGSTADEGNARPWATPGVEATPGANGAGPAEDTELEAPAATSATPAPARTPAPASSRNPTTRPAPAAATQPAVPAAAAAPAQPSAGFMRDLVAAMRRVAEETRQSSLSDLRAKSEEQVGTLESDSERLREELKSRAEADIAGVGAWARAEEERIKDEAEQRMVGRRAQLDQQLAAEASRAEAEVKSLRDRVAAYEAQLDAYHAQLSDIADPAAFAAAAKRMPPAPDLAGAPESATAPATATAPETAPPPAAPQAAGPSPLIHPAEEEVLTARLAELDATLDAGSDTAAASPSTPAPDAPRRESAATEVLVQGLGSFGAITGFRQSLASVDGIEGVSLSLGPTGEFVFRAIHAVGFDIAAAIIALEGDAATIEERPEGGLRVTLERAR